MRPMRADVIDNVWYCEACNFYASSHAIRINADETPIDEGRRLKALEHLRRRNFAIIFDWLVGNGFARKGEILEVGCGHGWFLDEAHRRGWPALGIEPDATIAAIARAAGHRVIAGYFPAALDPAAQYQALVFNDVFEHLPDIGRIADAIAHHAAEGGWVVVNLPVSEGLLFRIARRLAQLGFSGPYRRLWQVGMPSPHMSYFSHRALISLFASRGFELVGSAPLQSIDTASLFERIRYDRQIGLPAALAYYATAAVLAPALPFLPADISFFVFRKAARRT
jgi:SAM-dependent methyltransferase